MLISSRTSGLQSCGEILQAGAKTCIVMTDIKDTLLIIYRSLQVGGIENYVANVMRNSLRTGNRVIWVCNTEKVFSDVYKDVLNDEHIEIIKANFSGLDLYKIPEMSFSEDEKVKIMVFDIFRLFQAYKIKHKYKKIHIDILYCVPHFTGATIFPEQPFKGELIKRFLNNRFSEIYGRAFNQGNLYFFSSKHYHVIQEVYGIHFSNPKDYLLPHLEERENYDEDAFRRVYNSGTFIIISPGRFEFPHKGYLIGLIKTYEELKPLYPQLKLLIIGDGPDKKLVENTIQELSEDSRKDIIIQNPKTLEELKSTMKTVNLNIGVAGCASLGARMGLITLPARHYVYDCEVYGFFPESRNQTTDTKPGLPAKEYIEKIINMDEEEYIKFSKLAYHTFDDEKYDGRFPFIEHPVTNYVPSMRDFVFVKWTYNLQRVIFFIKRFIK